MYCHTRYTGRVYDVTRLHYGHDVHTGGDRTYTVAIPGATDTTRVDVMNDNIYDDIFEIFESE